jgi:hypothetical protein
MVRRSIAVAAAILILILLVLGIRGCLSARKERAFKDYVRDVSGIVEESDQQSDALFQLLTEPGDQTEVDIQNSVNGFRVQAEQLVERAKKTEHPDEVGRAQRFLVEMLEFRRDGTAAVAEELPRALGDRGRRQASERIAAQMQNFLASDVIYSQRVLPNLRSTLRKEKLLGEVDVPSSQFLPSIDWLDPATVADRIARIRGGGRAAATPGLHGTGLRAVTIQPSGIALTEGGSATIRVSEDLAFQVQVENQGENDEQDVNVRVSLRGGGEPIELEERIDAIAAGETKAATIPLADTPPTGEQVTIEVEIEAVPGEEKTDNNSATFRAIFTS